MTSRSKRSVRRPQPPGHRPRRTPAPLAVIDIGSNSGRVTVMRLHVNGHLDVIEDARAPLRLARAVSESGRLGSAAIERTLAALRDFRAIALGAGATSILAVATSAVREAADGGVLVERARRELGVRVVVIDGEREATFAYLGAVNGLPVDHGLLFDLGGGSLEVSRFRNRKLTATWTLPLGALRLSDRFLRGTAQPTAGDLRRLREFTGKTLRKAGIPRLARDEDLIGTGGTVRNLAKMQARLRRDPLPHIHGFVLALDDVHALVQRTTALGQTARGALPGLNKDRADSIVGGLVAIQTAMEFVGASQLQVSGQGLREGIALATLGKSPPPAQQVRRASIEALARRFSTRSREVARRRARIGTRLLGILDPKADPELLETLQYVCAVLDIGRAVDYFDRFRNCAMILAAADLQGFTPRGVALAFSVLMHADNEANRLKALRPALREKDTVLVERAAVLLRVADEIERRSLPGQALAIRYRLTRSMLALKSDALAGWQPGPLADRFRRAFGRDLRIGPA